MQVITVSQLIKHLTELQTEHGDVNFLIEDSDTNWADPVTLDRVVFADGLVTITAGDYSDMTSNWAAIQGYEERAL